MQQTGPFPQRQGPPAPPAIIWAMAAVMIGLELLFQLAEAGVLPRLLRFDLYVLGGFWDRYFDAMLAGEAYSFQLWPSFFTHAFLHGGLFHLIMNGVIFLGLGGMLANVLGPGRFLVLFLVTAAAGALVFGIIAETRGPLVGASGAIFGFFGAFKRWEWRYIRTTGAPANRFWGTIAALILINVLLYAFLAGSSLAWEAHLGGFIAGFLIAPILAPRLAGPSPI